VLAWAIGKLISAAALLELDDPIGVDNVFGTIPVING